MTNKPMFSVELLTCPMCAGRVREPAARPIGHGDVCFVVSCNCGLSFDGGQDIESAVRTWNRRAKPAAPHQGEPVAYRWRVVGHREWTFSDCSVEFDARSNDDRFEAQALYAEHPDPAADHTQCEECKGWGYHENHHEGGGTECGECGGSGKAPVEPFNADTVVCRRYQLEQSPGQNFYHYDLEPVYGSVAVTVSELITLAESAPVAVVMPEQKSVPEPEDYNTNIDEVAFAEGYNDALEDVARLNGVKP